MARLITLTSAWLVSDMDHVAIMKKEWGFIEKIFNGQKTIESRWYATKYKPWDMIKTGEIVYFKNSGEPVSLKAEVKKVMQFSDVNPQKAKEIFNKYGKDIGIEKENTAKFFKKFRGKHYCVLIFLKNPQKIKPFNINKKGFGAMASWITVKDIEDVKL